VETCRRYLERLPLSAGRTRALLELVQAEPDPRRALARLHHALSGMPRFGQHPALTSIRRRLKLAVPAVGVSESVATADGAMPLLLGPPLSRTPMAPRGWPAPPKVRRVQRSKARRSGGSAGRASRAAGPDARALAWTAAVRRTVFLVLVLVQTGAFAYFMTARALPYHGQQPLELVILGLSTILFAWVSLGFWTALSGFVLLCFGRDRHAISASAASARSIPPEARTAVVMPICNERVARVFAGLRATYASLAASGALQHFDLFVLSDSSEPDILTAERQAWLDLCAAVGGSGRIFYRWRQHRIKRKSGNIADFCRRWGSRYRYMVVLDADSVMSGECLATLVRLMEANPTAGIIQTAPRAAGRDSLYARAQQFATRVYGPLFTAGLHFWQLGESYYWGHNAIIRIEPFMRYCALGRLPGRGPLSGEILSHDFVEAALMRRAGWKVWMAYDLPGSYEEMPPSLVDELKRDRRWCHGNLINWRLFLWDGLNPAHRVVFMAGIMTYVSAPLWLLALAASTAFVVVQAVVGPQYFIHPRQLFPIWPQWDVASAVGCAVATLIALFLPKILGGALVVAHDAKRYGGVIGVAGSLLLEAVFSALLAPIRMLFHSQFVVAALTGLRIHWKSPPREDAETTWLEATRRHGAHTLLGGAWAAGVYWVEPWYLWWVSPVVGALLLSIPISVYSSRISVGRALRRAGLLVIPEETEPPEELRIMRAQLEGAAEGPRFIDAVVDPLVNAVACAVAAPHCRFSPRMEKRRQQAISQAVTEGPHALSDLQKRRFLSDPVALGQLHFEVWSAEDVHPAWHGVDIVDAAGDRAALAAAS
jgi:membrane glycosyltransferase